MHGFWALMSRRWLNTDFLVHRSVLRDGHVRKCWSIPTLRGVAGVIPRVVFGGRRDSGDDPGSDPFECSSDLELESEKHNAQVMRLIIALGTMVRDAVPSSRQLQSSRASLVTTSLSDYIPESRRSNSEHQDMFVRQRSMSVLNRHLPQ